MKKIFIVIGSIILCLIMALIIFLRPVFELEKRSLVIHDSYQELENIFVNLGYEYTKESYDSSSEYVFTMANDDNGIIIFVYLLYDEVIGISIEYPKLHKEEDVIEILDSMIDLKILETNLSSLDIINLEEVVNIKNKDYLEYDMGKTDLDIYSRNDNIIFYIKISDN